MPLLARPLYNQESYLAWVIHSQDYNLNEIQVNKIEK